MRNGENISLKILYSVHKPAVIGTNFSILTFPGFRANIIFIVRNGKDGVVQL